MFSFNSCSKDEVTQSIKVDGVEYKVNSSKRAGRGIQFVCTRTGSTLFLTANFYPSFPTKDTTYVLSDQITDSTLMLSINKSVGFTINDYLSANRGNTIRVSIKGGKLSFASTKEILCLPDGLGINDSLRLSLATGISEF